MKLRLRSMDQRGGAGAVAETHRVQLPDTATLSDVKAFLATKLSAAQPVPAESVRLTLNRSEELLAPDPSAALPAFGVASGDLLHFTLSPLPSPLPPPSQPQPQSQPLHRNPNANPSPVVPSIARAVGSTKSPVEPDAPSLARAFDAIKSPVDSGSSSSLPQASYLKPGLPSASDPHHPVPPDVVMADAFAATRSTPSFVVKAIKREIENAGGAGGSIIYRLAVALHAALLDSGFLSANPVGSRLQMPQDWGSGSFIPISMKYTVPELVEALPVVEGMVAVMSYSLMGNFMIVYGHVPGAPSEVRRLCLELPELVPLLYLDSDEVCATEEREINQLWRVLKDEMCLPLMILLCRLNNLSLPPCLMALPGDVKVKILDFIPGVDIARVQCTCKELRDLAADDNLWMKKCEMEFKAQGEGSRVGRTWKERFGAAWKVSTNKRPKTTRPRFSNYRRGYYPYSPHVFPVIGGDTDRLPFFGHRNPLGRTFGNQRRNISPSCNFSGHGHNFLG
ncbi:putative F-box protein At1g23770 [Oryza brachyantha]|uniref:putative F-box protein At1g23770 n=1 Tax=Oryza brachyantha TaxID=4533 RepID=UPI001AD9CFA0|nr:putative F-box protein At1g23770 [Oryza brachyantha]